jgi:hypothetical protein
VTNDFSRYTTVEKSSPQESRPNSRNEPQLKAKAVFQFDVCMRDQTEFLYHGE